MNKTIIENALAREKVRDEGDKIRPYLKQRLRHGIGEFITGLADIGPLREKDFRVKQVVDAVINGKMIPIKCQRVDGELKEVVLAYNSLEHAELASPAFRLHMNNGKIILHKYGCFNDENPDAEGKRVDRLFAALSVSMDKELDHVTRTFSPFFGGQPYIHAVTRLMCALANDDKKEMDLLARNINCYSAIKKGLDPHGEMGTSFARMGINDFNKHLEALWKLEKPIDSAKLMGIYHWTDAEIRDFHVGKLVSTQITEQFEGRISSDVIEEFKCATNLLSKMELSSYLREGEVKVSKFPDLLEHYMSLSGKERDGVDQALRLVDKGLVRDQLNACKKGAEYQELIALGELPAKAVKKLEITSKDIEYLQEVFPLLSKVRIDPNGIEKSPEL
ncbi:hypothetical protein D3C78_111800 [compost metagenome]